MRTSVALALLAQVLVPGDLDGPVLHDGSGGALFEFSPTTVPCDGAVPTGTKGEVASFSRGSAISCLKTSDTTGIPVGDLIKLSSNQPAVARRGTGAKVLGEDARTNLNVQSEVICNGAYTGTAACSTDTTASPDGATNAETLTDGSGAAIQCWSQAIATTTQSKYAFSVFGRRGSLSSVTLSLTGTGNAAGDASCALSFASSTTYDRLQCVSPAAYGVGLTGVTVQVCLGTVVGDTGTIITYGWQAEACTIAGICFASSYIPTAGTSAARVLGSGLTYTHAALIAAVSERGSFSMDLVPLSTAAGYSVITTGAEGRYSYSNSQTELRAYDGTNEIITAAHGMTGGNEYHVFTYWDQALTPQFKTRNVTTAVEASSSADGTWGTPGGTGIIIAGGAGSAPNGWVGAVKIDSNSTRLR